MKRITKTLIMLIITVLVLGISQVRAADEDSYKMGISVSTNSIKEGEKINITISLKDLKITSGDKGLGAYQATLEYDTNMFEYVSIKGLNSWDTPIYNNGTFATTTSTGEVIKKAEEVAQITLKAKNSLTSGKTTIKLKNITASTGTKTVSASNASKTITVEGTKQSGTNTQQDGTSSSSNGKSSTNKNGTTSSKKATSTKDSTTSRKVLPKTGIGSMILIYVFVPILLVVSTIAMAYLLKQR